MNEQVRRIRFFSAIVRFRTTRHKVNGDIREQLGIIGISEPAAVIYHEIND
jgi:hypothetical protein